MQAAGTQTEFLFQYTARRLELAVRSAHAAGQPLVYVDFDALWKKRYDSVFDVLCVSMCIFLCMNCVQALCVFALIFIYMYSLCAFICVFEHIHVLCCVCLRAIWFCFYSKECIYMLCVISTENNKLTQINANQQTGNRLR